MSVWDSFTREQKFILISIFEVCRRSGIWNMYMDRSKIVADGIFPLLALWGHKQLLYKIWCLDSENFREFQINFLKMLPYDTVKRIMNATDAMPYMREHAESLEHLPGIKKSKLFRKLEIGEKNFNEMEKLQELFMWLHNILDLYRIEMVLTQKVAIDDTNIFSRRFEPCLKLARKVAKASAIRFYAYKFDLDQNDVLESVKKKIKKS